MSEQMSDLEVQLAGEINAMFTTAQFGTPRAYFETPRPNGTIARGVYRVAAFSGHAEFDKFREKMLEVFKKIRERGGIHLYWRKSIEWYPISVPQRMYARFSVLDEALNDVTAGPDWEENVMGRNERDVNTDHLIVE